MAKILRKTQKILGLSAANIGVFGSAQAGTKILNNDPDIIQSAAWDGGWSEATVSGKKLPPLEETNGVDFVVTRQLSYLFQEGIPEWDAGTTYFQKSIVKKTGTYELYGSIGDNNLNNVLPNAVTDANWTYLGILGSTADPFSQSLLHVRDVKAAGTDGGTFTNGAWRTRDLQTVLTNEISGASLAANQIILPAGTYFSIGVAPAQFVNRHQARLQNITDGTTALLGTKADVTQNSTTESRVQGRFTIAATKTFELQHQCQTTCNTVGFGAGFNFAVSEIYSTVLMWKIA